MELNTQKYLRAGKGPQDLESALGIAVKRHPKYPNLVQFKYDQIESPKDDPIVQECRGLILDETNNWDIVAYPFKRFFNYQEENCAEIDWSKAQVMEKCDGSLCILFWYNEQWNVATSGSPDAGGPVGDFGFTFAELFWDTFKKENLSLHRFHPGFTWMFELCTPYNQVVVRHTKSSLYLLGARNIKTHVESILPEPWKVYNHRIKTPKRFYLDSVNKCIEAAKYLNPLQQEGYVVFDGVNRCKIKSPAYIALHHAKDTCSRKNLAEIIRSGEYGEFETALGSFPELRKDFDTLWERYNYIVNKCNEDYELIKNIEVQKEFALQAKTKEFPGILFEMRKTGCKPQAALVKMTGNGYLQLMGVK